MNLDFLITSLLFLVVTLALNKKHRSSWKSGLKRPLLHLGPSCPLQTILLSDLVRCGIPLQIVMPVWHAFLFETCQTAITYSLQRAAKPYPAKSNSKIVHQTAILICNVLFLPTGWAALHSDNLLRSLFLMNMKGLQ